MGKTSSISLGYRLAVLYRVLLAFVAGFIAIAYLSVGLSLVFSQRMPKAESIILAVLISVLLYIVFIIFSFCVHSLGKLTLVSAFFCASCFFLSWILG